MLDDNELNDLTDTISLLRTRRSASAKTMGEPGPTREQLDVLLEIAVRVPDHGKLTPWRFILFEKEARADMGELLVERWRQLHPDHGEAMLAEQRGMFLRAPIVLAVISTAQEHPKIPLWEQQLSAGAVCQNILIAATAMNIGCQWITGWYAFDAEVTKSIGLQVHERVAGFFYIGTQGQTMGERPRPDPATLLTHWRA